MKTGVHTFSRFIKASIKRNGVLADGRHLRLLGRIGDEDAVFGRRLHVDRVDADAELGNASQIRQRFDDLARDAHTAGAHHTDLALRRGDEFIVRIAPERLLPHGVAKRQLDAALAQPVERLLRRFEALEDERTPRATYSLTRIGCVHVLPVRDRRYPVYSMM